MKLTDYPPPPLFNIGDIVKCKDGSRAGVVLDTNWKGDCIRTCVRYDGEKAIHAIPNSFLVIVKANGYKLTE